jgi:hypothetical protein
MNFQARLDELRGKPEAVRKRVAFWSSFGLTALIFVFWVTTITIFSPSKRGGAVAAAVDKVGTPAQSLIAGVGGFFGDVKELIFTPKRVTYTDIEVEAGER